MGTLFIRSVVLICPLDGAYEEHIIYEWSARCRPQTRLLASLRALPCKVLAELCRVVCDRLAKTWSSRRAWTTFRTQVRTLSLQYNSVSPSKAKGKGKVRQTHFAVHSHSSMAMGIALQSHCQWQCECQWRRARVGTLHWHCHWNWHYFWLKEMHLRLALMPKAKAKGRRQSQSLNSWGRNNVIRQLPASAKKR